MRTKDYQILEGVKSVTNGHYLDDEPDIVIPITTNGVSGSLYSVLRTSRSEADKDKREFDGEYSVRIPQGTESFFTKHFVSSSWMWCLCAAL